MTTLYRTPNLVIDRHEWHAIVRRIDGRVSLAYRWRPLSTREHPWAAVVNWQGRKPKGLARFFTPYRRHIAFALECEVRRFEAANRLRFAA